MGFFDFFAKPKSNSKDVARDRLKLVLVQDRANISPKVLELMKADIIRVVSKYVEIDEDNLEMNMVQSRSENISGETIVANIPIKKMRDQKRN